MRVVQPRNSAANRPADSVFVSRGADLSTDQLQAIASISNIVRREAYVMAYNDCFYFIGITLFLNGIAVIFFKRVKAGGGAAAH